MFKKLYHPICLSRSPVHRTDQREPCTASPLGQLTEGNRPTCRFGQEYPHMHRENMQKEARLEFEPRTSVLQGEGRDQPLHHATPDQIIWGNNWKYYEAAALTHKSRESHTSSCQNTFSFPFLIINHFEQLLINHTKKKTHKKQDECKYNVLALKSSILILILQFCL